MTNTSAEGVALVVWLSATILCGCNHTVLTAEPTADSGAAGPAHETTIEAAAPANGAAPCDTGLPLAHPEDWEACFPALAPRVFHFGIRMASSDAGARQGAVTELTYFRFRDSEQLPRFARVLLHDASPVLRWTAASQIFSHGQSIPLGERSTSMEIPTIGLVDFRDEEQMGSLLRRLAAAATEDVTAGWILVAFRHASYRPAQTEAVRLSHSMNAFVRFSAAEALLEFGLDQEAESVLEGLTTQSLGDISGFYGTSAAEILVRRGRRGFLKPLLDFEIRRAEQGYAGNFVVMSDLTGAYFPTAQEWRQWLSTH